ncbi:MAG: nucleoside monophosphate kinase [Candidatus Sungiibacteriota bacterium]|uniref:Adenylate kinase n=1 Tax=Candidatus Sungiibacteriota bacterium TaxID=2750080 RepID=A0A7T5RJ45_9BACT|nr:MAG: nucleoside monophosphate kinase [Candidatus Sungbacteria bacterium]
MKNTQLKNKLATVILGRSGSGKGTQAKFIVQRLKKYGVRHLETGELLRSIVKTDNLTTQIIRQVMKTGGLVPGWVAAFAWLRELIVYGHANKHLVFDGAPRRIWEAELLDEVMRWHGRSMPYCLYIDVGAREATRRLLARGRSDDTPSAVRNRMKFFQDHVLTVLKYYKRQGRLIHINGEQSVKAIWREIDRTLARKLGRRWPRR